MPLQNAGLFLLAATVVYLGLTSVAELAVGLDWRHDAGQVTQGLFRGPAHTLVLLTLVIVATRGTQSRVFTVGQEALLPPLFMTSSIAAALAWCGRWIAAAQNVQAGRRPEAESPRRVRRILVACCAAAAVTVAACLLNVEVRTVPQPGGETSVRKA